jgi:hypothetical protein
VAPKQVITVTATRPDGTTLDFQALMRIDSSIEAEYFRHGGILQIVLRPLMNQAWSLIRECREGAAALRTKASPFNNLDPCSQGLMFTILANVKYLALLVIAITACRNALAAMRPSMFGRGMPSCSALAVSFAPDLRFFEIDKQNGLPIFCFDFIDPTSTQHRTSPPFLPGGI